MNYVHTILEKGGSNEDKFYEIADVIAEKQDQTGFDSLKMEEKNIFMIDTMLNEINNGGLDQYFFNTKGRYADDTINVLKMIGQPQLAEIIHLASILYNSDQADEDKFDKLNEYDEQIFSDVEFEELYKCCLNYLNSYSSKFN